MATHIIIDGYNLIRQSPSLAALDDQDLQSGREALIDRLVAYKRLKGHKITVVFDGHGSPPIGGSRKEQIKGIAVVFSRQGETADAVIMKMAATEKERSIVVTSDREIQRVASSQMAAIIDSPAFEEKLEMTEYIALKGDEDEGPGTWVPTTQKKGPRRRLSKKARRSRRKIRNL
jgi:predicted RNA-binding protein with PIN domain